MEHKIHSKGCTCGHVHHHGAPNVAVRWLISLLIILGIFILIKPFLVQQMFVRAASYFTCSSYDNAIRVCKKITMIDKRNAKAWTSIGYAYKEMGEIDAAIGAYGNAYVLSPEDKGSSFDLGMAYYSKNEFARAIPYFEKIRAAGSDSKNSILVDILNYHRGALTMLAECYKALGDTANFERINNEINKHYPRQGSTSPMSIFYEKTEKE